MNRRGRVMVPAPPNSWATERAARYLVCETAVIPETDAPMAFHETSPLNRQPNWIVIHWQDWLSILLSVWLFVSPWVLNFGGVVDRGPANAMGPSAMMAAWNAWVLGAIALALSLRMLIKERPTPRAIMAVLGVWIFFAPWVLGLMRLPAADWDHWITGALIAGLWFWRPMKRTPQS